MTGTPPRDGRPGGVPVPAGPPATAPPGTDLPGTGPSGAGLPGAGPSPQEGGDALAPWTDPDAAFFTVGQAGDLLGVPAATLRRFDALGAVSPARSAGGQRRYSSRQLTHARRLLELVSEGLTLAAAARIAALEDEVEELRQRLRGHGSHSGSSGDRSS